MAVEIVDDVALLRMLAVAPERRGEGLGYLLVETATERARSQGVRHLYLVTDGAQGYFGEKLGFSVVDRKDVAPEIAGDGRVPARPLEERHLDEKGAVTWLPPIRSDAPPRDPLARGPRRSPTEIAREAGQISAGRVGDAARPSASSPRTSTSSPSTTSGPRR